MPTLRTIIASTLLATCSFSFALTPEQEKPLKQLAENIESLAENNGFPMKVTSGLENQTLEINAVMTDEDDSIDYIAGYLYRENLLAMIAPNLVQVLESMQDIEKVNGSVSDQAGQALEFRFTAKEIKDYMK